MTDKPDTIPPPAAAASRTTRRLVASLPPIVLSLVALSYAGSLGGGWVWDDHFQIAASGAIDHPLKLWAHDVWWLAPNAGETSLYRPLSVLSYTPGRALDAGPMFERIFSLALHLLGVSLVAAIAVSLGATRCAAWFGAAAFGVHPGVSEAVAWISARHDLLGAVIVLAGWLALIQRRQVAAGILLGLAVFAKEFFIFVPLTVIVWDVGLRRRSWLTLGLSVAGMLVYLAARALTEIPLPSTSLNPQALLAAAGGVGVRGLELVAIPGASDAVSVLEPSFGFGAAALIAAIGSLWLLPGRAWVAAPLAALPLLAPAAAAAIEYGFIGDRYYYLFFCAMAVAIGLLLSPVFEKHRSTLFVWGLVPALALGTAVRTLEWKRDSSVFEASLVRDPSNPHAAFHLAHSVHVYENDCARAAPLYERGLDADPRAAGNLLACLLNLGELDRVTAIGPILAARSPDHPTPASNTARAHLLKREFGEAEHWAREAIRRDPNRASSWALLGGVLGETGRHAPAREAFARALELDSTDAAAIQGLEVIGREVPNGDPQPQMDRAP